MDVGGDYDYDYDDGYDEADGLSNALALYGLALIPALIIALIVCTIMKSSMKSAKKATAAREYVIPGGVEITRRHDQYTHTTRTEHRIRDDDDGGTTIDSDGFSGSGGKF